MSSNIPTKLKESQGLGHIPCKNELVQKDLLERHYRVKGRQKTKDGDFNCCEKAHLPMPGQPDISTDWTLTHVYEPFFFLLRRRYSHLISRTSSAACEKWSNASAHTLCIPKIQQNSVSATKIVQNSTHTDRRIQSVFPWNESSSFIKKTSSKSLHCFVSVLNEKLTGKSSG